MHIYKTVIGNYWQLGEGENVFSQIVTPGKEIMLYWKATQPKIFEHYQLVLKVFFKIESVKGIWFWKS